MCYHFTTMDFPMQYITRATSGQTAQIYVKQFLTQRLQTRNPLPRRGGDRTPIYKTQIGYRQSYLSLALPFALLMALASAWNLPAFNALRMR